MKINRICVAVVAVALLLFAVPARADDRFATALESVTGTFDNSLYRDPTSALGKPTT